MKKIVPCLWFDGQAEEAARFYTSLFENSRVLHVTRHGEGGPAPKGTAMSVTFELDGHPYMALNGGPHFKFTEAISLVVDCENQEEVDYFWSKLTAGGGSPSQCGWLKDKFGLSWQIVPKVMMEMLGDKDPVKSKRVMEAMLQMTKIDIGKLKQAYDQR